MMTRSKLLRILTRALAPVLSVILAAGPCLADTAQSSLWAERRSNIEKAAGSSAHPTLLASAMVARPDVGRLLQGLPRPGSTSLSPSIANHLSRFSTPDLKKRITDVVRALPAQAGTVRDIVTGRAGVGDRVVIHIQDVHLNGEAQTNIAAAVRELSAAKVAGVVALEGAFGPIDLSAFRAFPDRRAMKRIAVYLTAQNKISGPIGALMTEDNAPAVVGVDSEERYNANVAAYLRAEPLRKIFKQRVVERERALIERKRAVYSPQLIRFDAAVESYDKGASPLGAYIRLLARTVDDLPISIQAFLAAYDIESGLDFARVESERSRMLQTLVKKLKSEEIERLVADSLEYRTGRMGHGAFYAALRDLASRQGVSLAEFPAMDAYVRYVLLTDAIKSHELYRDIDALRERAFRTLATSPDERALVAEDERLNLAAKLINFSLTPEEWDRYAKEPKETLAFIGDLKDFESFYREADARNDALAGNLLRAMDEKGARVGVLITGGFHAPGVGARFAKAGISTISYVPRLTKVDVDGSAYLSVFSQEKAPLDQLFEGPKLFLAQAPAPAIGLNMAGVLGVAAGAQEQSVPIDALTAWFPTATGFQLLRVELAEANEPTGTNDGFFRVVYQKPGETEPTIALVRDRGDAGFEIVPEAPRFGGLARIPGRVVRALGRAAAAARRSLFGDRAAFVPVDESLRDSIGDLGFTIPADTASSSIEANFIVNAVRERLAQRGLKIVGEPIRLGGGYAGDAYRILLVRTDRDWTPGEPVDTSVVLKIAGGDLGFEMSTQLDSINNDALTLRQGLPGMPKPRGVVNYGATVGAVFMDYSREVAEGTTLARAVELWNRGVRRPIPLLKPDGSRKTNAEGQPLFEHPMSASEMRAQLMMLLAGNDVVQFWDANGFANFGVYNGKIFQVDPGAFAPVADKSSTHTVADYVSAITEKATRGWEQPLWARIAFNTTFVLAPALTAATLAVLSLIGAPVTVALGVAVYLLYKLALFVAVVAHEIGHLWADGQLDGLSIRSHVRRALGRPTPGNVVAAIEALGKLASLGARTLNRTYLLASFIAGTDIGSAYVTPSRRVDEKQDAAMARISRTAIAGPLANVAMVAAGLAALALGLAVGLLSTDAGLALKISGAVFAAANVAVLAINALYGGDLSAWRSGVLTGGVFRAFLPGAALNKWRMAGLVAAAGSGILLLTGALTPQAIASAAAPMIDPSVIVNAIGSSLGTPLLLLFGAVFAVNMGLVLWRLTGGSGKAPLNLKEFVRRVVWDPLWENGVIVLASSLGVEPLLNRLNVMSSPQDATLVAYAIVGIVFTGAHVLVSWARKGELNLRPVTVLAGLFVAFSVVFLGFPFIGLSFVLVFFMHGLSWNLLTINLRDVFGIQSDWFPAASIGAAGQPAPLGSHELAQGRSVGPVVFGADTTIQIWLTNAFQVMIARTPAGVVVRPQGAAASIASRESVMLEPGRTVYVGVSNDATLRLIPSSRASRAISRFHVAIEMDRAGRVTVRDLFSRNGGRFEVQSPGNRWAMSEGVDESFVRHHASEESQTMTRLSLVDFAPVNDFSQAPEAALHQRLKPEQLALQQGRINDLDQRLDRDNLSAQQKEEIAFLRAFLSILYEKSVDPDQTQEWRDKSAIYLESLINEAFVLTQRPTGEVSFEAMPLPSVVSLTGQGISAEPLAQVSDTMTTHWLAPADKSNSLRVAVNTSPDGSLRALAIQRNRGPKVYVHVPGDNRISLAGAISVSVSYMPGVRLQATGVTAPLNAVRVTARYADGTSRTWTTTLEVDATQINLREAPAGVVITPAPVAPARPPQAAPKLVEATRPEARAEIERQIDALGGMVLVFNRDEIVAGNDRANAHPMREREAKAALREGRVLGVRRQGQIYLVWTDAAPAAPSILVNTRASVSEESSQASVSQRSRVDEALSIVSGTVLGVRNRFFEALADLSANPVPNRAAQLGFLQSLVRQMAPSTMSVDERTRLADGLLRLFSLRITVHRLDDRLFVAEDQGSGETIMGIHLSDYVGDSFDPARPDHAARLDLFVALFAAWQERYGFREQYGDAYAAQRERAITRFADLVPPELARLVEADSAKVEMILAAAEILRRLPLQTFADGSDLKNRLRGGIDLAAERDQAARIGHYREEIGQLGIQPTVFQFREFLETFLHEFGHVVQERHIQPGSPLLELFAKARRNTYALPALGFSAETRRGYIQSDSEMFAETFMHYVLHGELFAQGFPGFTGDPAAWRAVYAYYRDNVFGGKEYRSGELAKPVAPAQPPVAAAGEPAIGVATRRAEYRDREGAKESDLLNEDASFQQELESGITIAGVIDGMGGAAAGEEASKLAGNIISRELQSLTPDMPESRVEEIIARAVRRADDAIRNQLPGSGATATVLVMIPQANGTHRAFIANAADTRAYLQTGSGLRMLTSDNDSSGDVIDLDTTEGAQALSKKLASQYQEAVAEVASRSDLEGIVGTAFKIRHVVYNDLGGHVPVKPAITKITVPVGGRIVLTSDGIHDQLTTAEMRAALVGTPAAAADRLAEAAYQRSLDKTHVRAKKLGDDATAVVVEARAGRFVPPAAVPVAAPKAMPVENISYERVAYGGTNVERRESFNGPVAVNVSGFQMLLTREADGSYALSLLDDGGFPSIGLEAPRVIPLGGITIGRASDSAVRIVNPRISRMQMTISVDENGRAVIREIGRYDSAPAIHSALTLRITLRAGLAFLSRIGVMRVLTTLGIGGLAPTLVRFLYAPVREFFRPFAPAAFINAHFADGTFADTRLNRALVGFGVWTILLVSLALAIAAPFLMMSADPSLLQVAGYAILGLVAGNLGTHFSINVMFALLDKATGQGSAWTGRTAEERVGEALMAAALAVTARRGVADIDELMGGIVPLNIGRVFIDRRFSAPVSPAAVNRQGVIDYLRLNIAGRLHAGDLSFAEAQRVAEKLSDWLGETVRIADRSVVAVARRDDVAGVAVLSRRGTKENPVTVFVQVADAGAFKAQPQIAAAMAQGRLVLISIGSALFSGGNRVNAPALEAALLANLDAAHLSNALLVLSNQVSFETANLAPGSMLAQIRYKALEDILNDLPAINVLPLGVILDAAKVLAVQA